MSARSFLFIPGDSEKKLAKGGESGADALILDLEDSVAPARKAAARAQSADFLRAHPPADRKSALWARINPLDTPESLADLAALLPGAPDGIVLPKANGPEDARRLGHYLDALEAANALPAQSVRILPVATETAIAPFRLGDYAGANLPRLYGLTWGAEDLSAALGASANTDPATGQWSFTYQMARSLTLLAAHAAGLAAIDTVFLDFKDEAGLGASCRAARAEGFSGRLAIHPAQVPIINESFAPSAAEIAFAKGVIAAFEAAPGAGVVAIGGKMFDIPHLKQARRVLAQAEGRGR